MAVRLLEALRDSEAKIPRGPKSLLSYCCERGGRLDAVSWPSVALIAWDLGCSRRSVFRWRGWLLAHGFLADAGRVPSRRGRGIMKMKVLVRALFEGGGTAVRRAPIPTWQKAAIAAADRIERLQAFQLELARTLGRGDLAAGWAILVEWGAEKIDRMFDEAEAKRSPALPL